MTAPTPVTSTPLAVWARNFRSIRHHDARLFCVPRPSALISFVSEFLCFLGSFQVVQYRYITLIFAPRILITAAFSWF